VGASSAADGKLLAHTVPLGRQLRVMLVMLVLCASVLHQLFLHHELQHVSDVLVAALAAGANGNHRHH
jgi:hypothetical protein